MDTFNLEATAIQARNITRASSKQTFFTARILVDRDLTADFYRAYAYFRWADDIVDGKSQTDQERINFIQRQRQLIDALYAHERPKDLQAEEEILADLITHDKQENSGLQSFIRNMFAVISFDAHRKGNLISQEELSNYIDILGKSVTDGLQYFIGNGHHYPISENRYSAAKAAHITHLLRDTLVDLADGFINIPREFIFKHKINLADLNNSRLQNWVRDQVDQARKYFNEGKSYLDSLEVFRCKLAGYWYCARFEAVLDTIERDNYQIRSRYDRRNKITSWLKFLQLTARIYFQHISQRIFSKDHKRSWGERYRETDN